MFGKQFTSFNQEGQSADRAVELVGIGSTAQDSMRDLANFAKDQQIDFKLAKDFGGKIGKRLGATRTSEVVVLDQRLTVRYQGRVDDEFEPGSLEPKSAVMT